MSDGVPPWLVDDPKEIAALWSAVEGITFTDDQPPTTEEINQQCRLFTDEEWDLYNKTLEESEECVYYIYPGFDTIELPANVAQIGVHVPLPVAEEEEPLMYANLMDDSKAAIDHYNNENGTNFEVVKVLKANWRLVEGAHIYITFQAENKTTGAFDNFQAIIYVFVAVREVQLVRLEPKKSQLLQESGKEARLDWPSKKKARLDLMSPSESKCTPRSLNSESHYLSSRSLLFIMWFSFL
ncbi:hypothetical protein RHMOL_Rhmol09G0035700 [Rhododendron molle]|uniref:Uncharacterized protein n=1 Tax=Rhododendron molle TaxID=49168 RepID=A0ACC0MAK3_RHOML|nr:hypothetical protein RHMOL_Rhmol09G0035700 [Rhododendron molle]